MVLATSVAMLCLRRACFNIFLLDPNSARKNGTVSTNCTASCLKDGEAACAGAVDLSREGLEPGRRSVSTACETRRHEANSIEDGRGRSRIW